jgi:hypothetical protein
MTLYDLSAGKEALLHTASCCRLQDKLVSCWTNPDHPRVAVASASGFGEARGVSFSAAWLACLAAAYRTGGQRRAGFMYMEHSTASAEAHAIPRPGAPNSGNNR